MAFRRFSGLRRDRYLNSEPLTNVSSESIVSLLPPGQDTTLGHEWREAEYVLSYLHHKSLCKVLILKTFVYVIEKSATKQWVMEKLIAGTSLNFKRIFDGLDPFKIEFLKPRSSFFCRWSFLQICLESVSLVEQPLLDHRAIHQLPQ